MGFIHIYRVSVCGKENKEYFPVHYTGAETIGSRAHVLATEADVTRFILTYLRDGFKVEICREV
jgi:hypothetical protein